MTVDNGGPVVRSELFDGLSRRFNDVACVRRELVSFVSTLGNRLAQRCFRSCTVPEVETAETGGLDVEKNFSASAGRVLRSSRSDCGSVAEVLDDLEELVDVFGREEGVGTFGGNIGEWRAEDSTGVNGAVVTEVVDNRLFVF